MFIHVFLGSIGCLIDNVFQVLFELNLVIEKLPSRLEST